jgi:branched-subunit amino acid transport protein
MRIEIMFTIFVMAVATFATRFASQALFGNRRVDPQFSRFLKHMPTAMLTALIAPAIFAPQGIIAFTSNNPYLIAGSVATFLAYRRQSPIVTMGGSMAVMLVIRSFGI